MLRNFEASESVRAEDVAETADGGLLVTGNPRALDSDGFIMRTDSNGKALWAFTYHADGFSRLYNVWEEPDSSIRAVGSRSGAGQTEMMVLALGADGMTSSACVDVVPEALVESDLTVSFTSLDLVASGAGVQDFPGSVVNIDPGCVGFDPCECAEIPRPVESLTAVRRGNDVDLTWDAAADADTYHVWSVPTREGVPRARMGSPVARGVVGCSPPTPAAVPSCLDVGAIGRPGDEYYNAVSLCAGGLVEGP